MRLTSQQRLRAALAEADFKPHTLTTGADYLALARHAPPAVAAFLNAWSDESGPVALLSSTPFSDALMRRYRSLTPDEQLAVMALAGFTVHESMHKIDFLTTPFGVSFQGRACLETLGLQLDAAELLDELRRTDPHRPLRDLPRRSEAYVVRDGVAALGARIRWFDALRGAAPAHVTPGWGDDGRLLPLLNARLQTVLVHDLMPTLALPDAHGAYLRPLTILESRALAVTGLNLLKRLGDDEFAAGEVARFVAAFYSPAADYPDYRFLLDLYAGAFGEPDFVAAIAAHGRDWLANALLTIITTGWYALHSTPKADAEAVTSSPVVRLVFALEVLIEQLQAQRRWPHAVAFFEEVDATARARGLELAAPHETFRYCFDYVRAVRRRNADTNPHGELAEHFDRILALQQEQMLQRAEHGYASLLGMPDDGDLIRLVQTDDGLGSHLDAVEQRLLLDELEPPASVGRWFGLRETLLFRQARPPSFWDELWGALSGADQAAGSLTAAEARGFALARARFAEGGHWARGADVVERAGDGAEIACVGVPPDALPVTLRMAAARAVDDVETQWEVLVERATLWCALTIAFARAGEKVRILFLMDRHARLLQAIASTRSLLLGSADGIYCALQGRAHPELVLVPVTVELRSLLAGRSQS